MNKPKKKRVVKIVKHSFEGGVEQLLDIVKGQSDKIKELIAKHNEHVEKLAEIEKRQQQIAIFSAQEFGKLMAHSQHSTGEIAKSIDHIDLNVLATAEILKEVFGQLSQIDCFIKKLTPEGKVLDLSEEEVENVKKEASEWFSSTVGSAFRTVQQKRAEEEQARLAELEKAKKEAEEAAKKIETDQTEKEKAEKALAEAATQERSIQTVSGGPGADIPEGADVFGG